MKRLTALGLLLGLCAVVWQVRAADADDKEQSKEALQALQDFVGGWKGNGGPDKPRPGPRDPIWSEKVSWSWRFKGEPALVLTVKGGKVLKGGELRYLPAKKRYQLTATTKDDKKIVFLGQLKSETLTLERVDPTTKATQQIKMNLAGDGVRFIYRVAHKDDGTTLWKKDYLVACTKDGESLGAKEKKNLCVVTGGVGTMTVRYKGETYYVCCSGCAEEFKENPEKYIAEFKKKNKK